MNKQLNPNGVQPLPKSEKNKGKAIDDSEEKRRKRARLCCCGFSKCCCCAIWIPVTICLIVSIIIIVAAANSDPCDNVSKYEYYYDYYNNELI